MEEVLTLPRDEGDLADGLIEAERHDVLRRRLLEVLSAFEVDVLRLYAEGRSYQEISARLGITEGNVKTRINRARARLRALLERDRGDA